MDQRGLDEGGTISRLVRSRDLYLSVFDWASPVNRRGEYGRALKRAKQLAGNDPWILAYNQYWIDHQGAGNIQSWITILDGIFKVRIHMVPGSSEFPVQQNLENGFLGSGRGDAILKCTSGRMVIASPAHLGGPGFAAVTRVAPGIYRAAITWNFEQEERHWDLEKFSQYPRGDGPDGILYLQRRSMLASG